jgi:Na+/melibiose symporter-like transporter
MWLYPLVNMSIKWFVLEKNVIFDSFFVWWICWVMERVYNNVSLAKHLKANIWKAITNVNHVKPLGLRMAQLLLLGIRFYIWETILYFFLDQLLSKLAWLNLHGSIVQMLFSWVLGMTVHLQKFDLIFCKQLHLLPLTKGKLNLLLKLTLVHCQELQSLSLTIGQRTVCF